jgi:hypothetical protein
MANAALSLAIRVTTPLQTRGRAALQRPAPPVRAPWSLATGRSLYAEIQKAPGDITRRFYMGDAGLEPATPAV